MLEEIDRVVTEPHYYDVIMGTIASQITSLTIVYSTFYSDVDQRKHQSSVSLAIVRGIHRRPVNSRTKGQLRGKCFHLMTSSRIHRVVTEPCITSKTVNIPTDTHSLACNTTWFCLTCTNEITMEYRAITVSQANHLQFRIRFHECTQSTSHVTLHSP